MQRTTSVSGSGEPKGEDTGLAQVTETETAGPKDGSSLGSYHLPGDRLSKESFSKCDHQVTCIKTP